MIIDESTIDTILQSLEEDEKTQNALSTKLESEFEDYLSYLNLEILKILNPQEGEQLLFLVSVLLEAFAQKGIKPEDLDLFKYFDVEEKMWALYEENLKKPFHDRITVYFEQIDEEEALAFLEDSLVEPEEGDEDNPMSSTGRDVIWNTCAALIAKLAEGSTTE